MRPTFMDPRNSEGMRGKRLRHKYHHLILPSCLFLTVLCGVICFLPAIDLIKDDEDPLARITNQIIYNGPNPKRRGDILLEMKLRRDRVAKSRKALTRKCFNSQHKEDLIMLQRFLGNVTGGFFIELGALDGMTYSSTYFFERFMNWRGLLIEGSPASAALFRQFYTAFRPRSEYIEGVVCAGIKEQREREEKENDLISVHRQSRSHLNRIKRKEQAEETEIKGIMQSKEIQQLTYVTYGNCKECSHILELLPLQEQKYFRQKCHMGSETQNGSTQWEQKRYLSRGHCLLTPTKCIRLSEILRKRCILKVDLFILDVEGAELMVLRSMDLLQGPPVHFIIVELSGKAEKREREVRRLLRTAGFVPRGRIALSELWENANFTAALRQYIQQQYRHNKHNHNNNNNKNSYSNSDKVCMNNNNNSGTSSTIGNVLYGPGVSEEEQRRWIDRCFVGKNTPAMLFRESTQQWIPPFHTIDEVI